MRNPQNANQPERIKELMGKYMEASKIERSFAKILGDRVILKYTPAGKP